MKDKVKKFTRAQRRAMAREADSRARKQELARSADKAYYKGHEAGYRAGRDSVIPVKVVERNEPPRVWIGPKEREYRVYLPARDKPQDYWLEPPQSELFHYGGEVHMVASEIEALDVGGLIVQWPRWSVRTIVPRR